MSSPAVRNILIQTLGGNCQICDYSACTSAMDFHHVDPKTKSFNFGIKPKNIKIPGLSLSLKNLPLLLEEIKKCVLLCKNCHTEVHAGLAKCPGLNNI